MAKPRRQAAMVLDNVITLRLPNENCSPGSSDSTQSPHPPPIPQKSCPTVPKLQVCAVWAWDSTEFIIPKHRPHLTECKEKNVHLFKYKREMFVMISSISLLQCMWYLTTLRSGLSSALMDKALLLNWKEGSRLQTLRPDNKKGLLYRKITLLWLLMECKKKRWISYTSPVHSPLQIIQNEAKH